MAKIYRNKAGEKLYPVCKWEDNQHKIYSKRLYGYNLHIPSETLPDISRFVPAGTRSSGWDLQHL